jgi:hypothetical protein
MLELPQEYITAIISMALLRTGNEPADLQYSTMKRKRVSSPLLPATPVIDV